MKGEREREGERNKIDRQLREARAEATFSSSSFQVSWKNNFVKVF